MEYTLGPIEDSEREAVINILNYYVENSFAAYPENKLPYQAFDMLMQMSAGYPTVSIKDGSGKTLGFGMLHKHSPIPTFARTAEITYFIHPDYTGKGLGKLLLDFLEKGAPGKGIRIILASISSLNVASLKFHRKNGFIECGLFKAVGIKHGQEFDTVWMQKAL